MFRFLRYVGTTFLVTIVKKWIGNVTLFKKVTFLNKFLESVFSFFLICNYQTEQSK